MNDRSSAHQKTERAKHENTGATARLVLASASPRRRELLSLFGVDFEVEPADIDETVLSGERPSDYVRRVAADKALAVHRRAGKRFVLGSDTAVVLDGECLGKPDGEAAARAMLERLSGTAHQVLSAVALVAPDGGLSERSSSTEVEFARLPDDWIERYIASGEPHDKAGAYGIQGAAGIWVRSLSGSYSGVVGLPLFETGELLREAGLAR
jgi:septum formation protein